MSSTSRAITSQPRSLLSIARLNMARSRARPSTINRVLMDQTCFGRSGGLAPISLPLFHGVRGRSFEGHSHSQKWSYSSVTENQELARQHARRRKKHVSFQRLAVVHGSSPVLGPPVLTQGRSGAAGADAE